MQVMWETRWQRMLALLIVVLSMNHGGRASMGDTFVSSILYSPPADGAPPADIQHLLQSSRSSRVNAHNTGRIHTFLSSSLPGEGGEHMIPNEEAFREYPIKDPESDIPSYDWEDVLPGEDEVEEGSYGAYSHTLGEVIPDENPGREISSEDNARMTSISNQGSEILNARQDQENWSFQLADVWSYDDYPDLPHSPEADFYYDFPSEFGNKEINTVTDSDALHKDDVQAQNNFDNDTHILENSLAEVPATDRITLYPAEESNIKSFSNGMQSVRSLGNDMLRLPVRIVDQAITPEVLPEAEVSNQYKISDEELQEDEIPKEDQLTTDIPNKNYLNEQSLSDQLLNAQVPEEDNLNVKYLDTNILNFLSSSKSVTQSDFSQDPTEILISNDDESINSFSSNTESSENTASDMQSNTESTVYVTTSESQVSETYPPEFMTLGFEVSTVIPTSTDSLYNTETEGHDQDELQTALDTETTMAQNQLGKESGAEEEKEVTGNNKSISIDNSQNNKGNDNQDKVIDRLSSDSDEKESSSENHNTLYFLLEKDDEDEEDESQMQVQLGKTLLRRSGVPVDLDIANFPMEHRGDGNSLANPDDIRNYPVEHKGANAFPGGVHNIKHYPAEHKDTTKPGIYQYHFQDPKNGEYKFGYGGDNQWRHEERRGDGVVVGRYGWHDATGKHHITHYVADNRGYRIIRPGQQVITYGSDSSPPTERPYPSVEPQTPHQATTASTTTVTTRRPLIPVTTESYPAFNIPSLNFAPSRPPAPSQPAVQPQVHVANPSGLNKFLNPPPHSSVVTGRPPIAYPLPHQSVTHHPGAWLFIPPSDSAGFNRPHPRPSRPRPWQRPRPIKSPFRPVNRPRPVIKRPKPLRPLQQSINLQSLNNPSVGNNKNDDEDSPTTVQPPSSLPQENNSTNSTHDSTNSTLDEVQNTFVSTQSTTPIEESIPSSTPPNRPMSGFTNLIQLIDALTSQSQDQPSAETTNRPSLFWNMRPWSSSAIRRPPRRPSPVQSSHSALNKRPAVIQQKPGNKRPQRPLDYAFMDEDYTNLESNPVKPDELIESEQSLPDPLRNKVKKVEEITGNIPEEQNAEGSLETTLKPQQSKEPSPGQYTGTVKWKIPVLGPLESAEPNKDPQTTLKLTKTTTEAPSKDSVSPSSVQPTSSPSSSSVSSLSTPPLPIELSPATTALSILWPYISPKPNTLSQGETESSSRPPPPPPASQDIWSELLKQIYYWPRPKGGKRPTIE